MCTVWHQLFFYGGSHLCGLRQDNYHDKLKNTTLASQCKQQSCSGDHQSAVGFTGYVFQIIYMLSYKFGKCTTFQLSAFRIIKYGMKHFVRFEVLMAVTLKITVFCDVMPLCSHLTTVIFMITLCWILWYTGNKSKFFSTLI
jgi:hypothetical protein